MKSKSTNSWDFVDNIWGMQLRRKICITIKFKAKLLERSKNL